MGITVDMFCKTYKANIKAKDKTFTDFINKHITTKYVDYIKKTVYCEGIIKATCFVKDGDREFISFNSPNRYLFFVMRLIELYTDIEIDDENVVGDYDKLNEIGAIDTIIATMPEREYTEFTTILNMKLDDLRDNMYSMTALAYNFKESLSLSEEVMNAVIQELKKQGEEE